MAAQMAGGQVNVGHTTSAPAGTFGLLHGGAIGCRMLR